MRRLRFSTYTHQLILKNGLIVTRKFIVLRDTETKTIVFFTDFHKYVNGDKNAVAKSISEDGNKRHTYVVKFLNHVFFTSEHPIEKLTDITLEIIADFLNAYGMGELQEDDNLRSEATVKRCVTVIIDFLDELTRQEDCRLKNKDLYKEVEYRTRKGKIRTKKVPVFEVRFIPKETYILRDMPEKVFALLMNRIRTHYPDILMTAAASAFAGLRPGETVNIRRRDSVLGPGLKFTIEDGEVIDISIDLTKELNLRSDHVRVAGIKKERTAKVYPAFLNLFYEFYLEYMKYMEGRAYEEEYGPLSVNQRGKAMTYSDYRNRFKKVVNDMIPICLESDDPEVVRYGMLLQEHSLGPHVLRHWFSVKLVLFGEDVAGLMYYRGDKSPESALTYLQDKSELNKRYEKMNNELFDYRTWQAEKYFGR